MENTEIMNNEAVNEAVVEKAEDVVKATSNANFKGVAIAGVSMVAGALAYKFVIKPVASKIKDKREKKKKDKEDPENGVIDVEFEEVENDYEEE